MATATISPDQDVIHAEVFIAAPPERVFEAITDPDQRQQWWGQKGLYTSTESHSDLRPGGKWWGAGVSADGKPYRVEGEYLDIDRPRLPSVHMAPKLGASAQDCGSLGIGGSSDPRSAASWPAKDGHWNHGQTAAQRIRWQSRSGKRTYSRMD